MRIANRAMPLILLAAAVCLAGAAPPNLTEALDTQRALANQSPGDVRVLNDLGNLLVLAGELEQAEAVYQEALALDPEHAASYYNLALLLHQTGRTRSAVPQLRRAVEIEPDNAWAHYQLGTLLAKIGKRKRAIEHYASALELEPRLAQPEFNSHILENRLATPAILTAFSLRTPGSAAPRLYGEPSRIAGLLVPSVEPTEPESPVPAETEPVAPRASFGPTPDEAPPAAAEELEEGVREPRQAQPPASPRPERGGRRVVPRAEGRPGGLAPAGSEDARFETAGSGRQEQAPTEESREAPQDEASEPPPERREPDPGPDVPSTGRLELRLLPSDGDRLAALDPGAGG